MIVRFTGILESIDGNEAVVVPGAGNGGGGGDGGGFAYAVLLPRYLARRLQDQRAVGKPVVLHTFQYLESQGQGASFVPRLVGFGSARERDFFEVFTTVKGLGTKRALRALAEEPGSIAEAIAGRDTRRLRQLPEIGPRLAETIIAELHGKVEAFADLAPGRDLRPGGAPGAPVSPVAQEAVDALVNLGEQRPEAERKVAKVLQRNPKLADAGEIVQAALSGR